MIFMRSAEVRNGVAGLFGSVVLILLSLVGVAGRAAETDVPAARSPGASGVPLVWRLVPHDGPEWDLRRAPDHSDWERAGRFFGSPGTIWEKVIWPTYEHLLTYLQEPSLSGQRTNKLAREYRLLYLPSRATPIVIRLSGGSGEPTVRLYAFAVSDSPALIAPVVTVMPCPKELWSRFLSQVQAAKFWDKAPHPETIDVKDGNMMVLEALDRGRYRMVERFERVENFAGEDDSLERLCLVLLEWAPVEEARARLELDHATAERLVRQRAVRKAQPRP